MGHRTNPATRWAAVTPSDTVDLKPSCRGIWCEAAGVVALVGSDDIVVNFTVEAKVVYPFGCKRVNTTNTTATGIVALY